MADRRTGHVGAHLPRSHSPPGHRDRRSGGNPVAHEDRGLRSRVGPKSSGAAAVRARFGAGPCDGVRRRKAAPKKRHKPQLFTSCGTLCESVRDSAKRRARDSNPQPVARHLISSLDEDPKKPEKSSVSATSAAQGAALPPETPSAGPQLASVSDAWPTLPAATRGSILAIIQATGGRNTSAPPSVPIRRGADRLRPSRTAVPKSALDILRIQRRVTRISARPRGRPASPPTMPLIAPRSHTFAPCCVPLPTLAIRLNVAFGPTRANEWDSPGLPPGRRYFQNLAFAAGPREQAPG